MALTVQDIARGGVTANQGTVVKDVPGDRFKKRITVTGDGAYPTGGYPLTPAACGMRQIDYVTIMNEMGPGNPANMWWFYNRVTGFLQLVVASTGAEVNNGTNVAAAVADIEVEGY